MWAAENVVVFCCQAMYPYALCTKAKPVSWPLVLRFIVDADSASSVPVSLKVFRLAFLPVAYGFQVVSR